MHQYALVNQLINDQDDTAHIVDEWLALYLVFEDFVETLIHAVEYLTKDQLVVFADANYVDGHVRVASEYCHVVFYYHDVVFKRDYGVCFARGLFIWL